MTNVYFKRITDFEDKDLINDITYQMLEKIVNDGYELDTTMPLKVHFGEDGNQTFIKPDNFMGIKKFLSDKSINSCYIETNVLYKGSRTLTVDHIKTAKNHGFNDLEIVIADSDEDNPYNEIEVNLKHFKTCKIGSKYSDYNKMIVISHFKGHVLTGFGGAIKQLGMGCAARAGKMEQHTNLVPIIEQNKCIECGSCVNKCPVEAISLLPKATINPNICIGCAGCIVACPIDIIHNSWQGSNFTEKLAEYAYAATKNKKNIYIQYAFNITEECDCVGAKLPIVAPNIGVFIGTDPVAVDKASLDKFQELVGNNKFDKAREVLSYAKEIGLGELDYNLIEL